MGSPTFQSQYFKLTAQEAAKTTYDIVIVGAGFGGGTLAADLFVRNKSHLKKILVVERGDLVFHSHCFNAVGPTTKGISDQQCVAFFKSFRDRYETTSSPDWDGGPLYALGGRSDVWSLFIPRPHDDTLKNHFPSIVVNELNDTFFEMAESTLNISIPTNPKLVHWNLVYELNKTYEITAKTTADSWQCGRTASEFKQDKNFTFAAGAYSTVDRLLEIAMNDPEAKKDFKILLGSKVHSLQFNNNNSIESVMLDGDIKVNTKHVVLCAGSVHSAAILLRSQVDIEQLGGGHLTDHDVYSVEKTFTYSGSHPNQDSEEVGSMRLQAYTNLGTLEHAALARITINPPTPAQSTEPTPPVNFQMDFILSSNLQDSNTITLEYSNTEPIIHITRTSGLADHQEAMVSMTNHAMAAVEKTLKVKFDRQSSVPKPLKLGAWAHELGSLPMPSADTSAPSVLDVDLTLKGGYSGVSVCDNSVFPFSPSVNPSLTLAALALRLSAFLLPRSAVVDIAAGDSQG